MGLEIKEVAEALTKDFELFKKTNNELLAAKADGKSIAALEEKLTKIETSLTNSEKMIDRLSAIETAMKRVPTKQTADGREMSADEVKHVELFNKWLRKGVEQEGRGGVVQGVLQELESKALAVNDDTAGGFMVHADLSGRIVKRVFETSPIRMYAAGATISTDAMEGPVDTDEGSAGWTTEAGPRTQTNTPKIGMWRITTHEIYAQPACTQKLLDDAAWDSESWLADKIADKISRIENAAFVLGDGVGKPRGFLSYGGIAENPSFNYWDKKQLGYIATGAADNFPDVPSSGSAAAQADPLINLIYSLKGEYRDRPGTAFAMHRTMIGRVRRLRDNMGNYLWQLGLAGAPSTLLGYPVAEFNDMPKLGDTNKFGIAFGNWAEGYQIVDRIGIRILRDPFTSKPFVLFYTTKRVGGDVINFEAIKLLKFATT